MALTPMRLHIQKLQRIVSVTDFETSRLQATHYPTDATLYICTRYECQ